MISYIIYKFILIFKYETYKLKIPIVNLTYHIIIIKLHHNKRMKIFGLFALLGLALANKCPQDKEIECVTDVNHALDICDKAAK